MAGRLGRPYGLARGTGTPIVVEEKIIARAEISRPGAVPGAPPTAAISLEEHKKVKTIIDRAGERGDCVPIDTLASEAGMPEEKVNASMAILKEDEYSTQCCPTYICSYRAAENMLSRIKRWRSGG